MSLGSLYLKFRQKYQHGLRVAHYRDRVRPRILETQPIPVGADTACEIHVLTSAQDWLNLMWALKSFFHHARRPFPLVIHDDSTLTEEQWAEFRRHFPGARFAPKAQADVEVDVVLNDYPRCQHLRRTNTLAAKVFDFAHTLDHERMFLLDSDVLFFAPPQWLLDRIDDPASALNTVNRDTSSAYTVDPAVVQEELGFELIDRFNSGLGLIHQSSMRLDWLEEFLGLPDIIGHHWRIEQTLIALLSSRHGTELMPPEYDVRLETGLTGLPSRHYVGAIRHLMYGEGMRSLVRGGFLRDLS